MPDKDSADRVAGAHAPATASAEENNDSTPNAARPPLVGLFFEGVDLDLIDVTLDPPSVPPSLAWCWAQLEMLAPDPARVELVVTGSFPDSIARHVPQEDVGGAHDVAHGAGLAAGKTLRMSDGRAVVLLHAHCFRSDLDQDQREVNELIVKRVLMHEAQHVVMHQNEQVYRADPGASFRSLNLVGGAAAIIEEYRAELSVGEDIRRGEPLWDPFTVVADLQANLDRAVAVYQGHRSVGRMVFEVTTAVLVAWRGLAYAAARDIVVASEVEPLVEAGAPAPWRRAFAGQWHAFRTVLRRAEPGGAIMPTETLDALADEFAAIIEDSMADLGFWWHDGWFSIESWFVESESFASALASARVNAASVTERFRMRWRRRPVLGGSIPR